MHTQAAAIRHVEQLDPALLAGALAAWQSARVSLAHHAHPGWFQALGLREPPWHAPASTVCAALELGSPQATSFAWAPHRVGVFKPACLRRLLRLRALMPRRHALRHCLQQPVHQRATAAVGQRLYAALLAEPFDVQDGGHPEISEDTLDNQCLEWEGWCALERDKVWRDPAIARLGRLQFAPGLLPVPGHADPGAAQWWSTRAEPLMLEECTPW